MTVSPVPSPKGRVLIAGATGFIGQFVAAASLDAHRPTYILARPGPRSPSKAKIFKALEDKGAIIVYVHLSLSLSVIDNLCLAAIGVYHCMCV